MTDTPFLAGKDIYLRPLVESDCDGPYPDWFNDLEACRGNSHHLFPYTPEAAREYVRQSNAAKDKLVLAIILSEGNKHIGNIALDNINYINRTAELSIIIGDNSCWNKGYGRQAAKLICDHGFLSLNLSRIACGTFENNVAMQKLAEYLGMVREGVRRKAVYKSGQYLDVIEYGILREEYLNHFNIKNEKD
jgi:RimJ/RimL family protein N-acetyltransferase